MEGREKRVDEIVKERKKGYIGNQKDHLLNDEASRNFFTHVKNFSKFERPEQFDVRTLLPGKQNKEVAEELADYFINSIRYSRKIYHPRSRRVEGSWNDTRSRPASEK